MALQIETFSNAQGGHAFFKAIGHPLAARKVPGLLAALKGRRVALYDPWGYATAFNAIHPLSGVNLVGCYVQDLGDIGKPLLGHSCEPVTDLKASRAEVVLVTAFDAERLVHHITHLLPKGAEVLTLDELRLPEVMLSTKPYLSALNFATNFAFFRDQPGHHTRIATGNYWSGYAPVKPIAWCCLFDDKGQVLKEWQQALTPLSGAAFTLDSAEVRQRFGLPAFTGQLFLQISNIAGHDVVKYALDTYGDDDQTLSCTHDANAWPSDHFAGLPAPKSDERVILWLQNSHPREIPAGALSLNRMGEATTVALEEAIPPFGTRALDTRELLPDLLWPAQLEVNAGKHVVRPRYEVLQQNGRQRIAHVNVERTDLKSDPKIPELANLMGKGHILPAPVLPHERYRTIALPTPMSKAQNNLPLALAVFDPNGKELGRQRLGVLPRNHAVTVDAGELLNGHAAYGHLELTYDFAAGGEADGWLHGLFRYEDKNSGHIAESSFGAHIFNTVLTYRGEPQSYAGRAPGLSTRLFLRVGGTYGGRATETFCQLIYPASTPWHGRSETDLLLTSVGGDVVASHRLNIACGGSRLFRASEFFTAKDLAAAGEGGYILIRDVTCRLFGYHGLEYPGRAFSLDHMFGY